MSQALARATARAFHQPLPASRLQPTHRRRVRVHHYRRHAWCQRVQWMAYMGCQYLARQEQRCCQDHRRRRDRGCHFVYRLSTELCECSTSLKSQACSRADLAPPAPASGEVLAVQSGTLLAPTTQLQLTTLLGVATESSRSRGSDQHSNAAAAAVHSELLK